MKQLPMEQLSESEYEKMDEGIREVVRCLRNGGFDTFMSCQGGEGHSFCRPIVGINFKGAFVICRKNVAEYIRQHVGPYIATIAWKVFYCSNKTSCHAVYDAMYVEFRPEIKEWKPVEVTEASIS